MTLRVSLVWLCLAALLLAAPAFAAPDPVNVFEQRWQRHDLLVANGEANRSWTWGPPAPLTDVTTERYPPDNYDQQEIQVQYFDKGRMEISNPEGDPADCNRCASNSAANAKVILRFSNHASASATAKSSRTYDTPAGKKCAQRLWQGEKT